MLDRVIDRMPALLVLASLALLGHVAIEEVQRDELLVAGIPGAVLLIVYLVSGRAR